jgi:hypothetical protein
MEASFSVHKLMCMYQIMGGGDRERKERRVEVGRVEVGRGREKVFQKMINYFLVMGDMQDSLS